jgi:hypothetical protein
MESQLNKPMPCIECSNDTHDFYTNEQQEDIYCCSNCFTGDTDDRNSAEVDAQYGDR